MTSQTGRILIESWQFCTVLILTASPLHICVAVQPLQFTTQTIQHCLKPAKWWPADSHSCEIATCWLYGSDISRDSPKPVAMPVHVKHKPTTQNFHPCPLSYCRYIKMNKFMYHWRSLKDIKLSSSARLEPRPPLCLCTNYILRFAMFSYDGLILGYLTVVVDCTYTGINNS